MQEITELVLSQRAGCRQVECTAGCAVGVLIPNVGRVSGANLEKAHPIIRGTSRRRGPTDAQSSARVQAARRGSQCVTTTSHRNSITARDIRVAVLQQITEFVLPALRGRGHIYRAAGASAGELVPDVGGIGGAHLEQPHPVIGRAASRRCPACSQRSPNSHRARRGRERVAGTRRRGAESVISRDGQCAVGVFAFHAEVVERRCRESRESHAVRRDHSAIQSGDGTVRCRCSIFHLAIGRDVRGPGDGGSRGSNIRELDRRDHRCYRGGGYGDCSAPDDVRVSILQ